MRQIAELIVGRPLIHADSSEPVRDVEFFLLTHLAHNVDRFRRKLHVRQRVDTDSLGWRGFADVICCLGMRLLLSARPARPCRSPV